MPAGKEDQAKHQQGTKNLWHTNRERRPCCMPAEKEDPFVQQQGKTLLSLSLVLFRDIGHVALAGVATCN